MLILHWLPAELSAQVIDPVKRIVELALNVFAGIDIGSDVSVPPEGTIEDEVEAREYCCVDNLAQTKVPEPLFISV